MHFSKKNHREPAKPCPEQVKDSRLRANDSDFVKSVRQSTTLSAVFAHFAPQRESLCCVGRACADATNLLGIFD
jgi:hypothetical protein